MWCVFFRDHLPTGARKMMHRINQKILIKSKGVTVQMLICDHNNVVKFMHQSIVRFEVQ